MVEIGKVAAAHGIKGGLKFWIYNDDDIDSIAKGNRVRLVLSDREKDVTILRSSPMKRHWLTQLVEVSDRNDAESWKGSLIYAEIEDLEDGNYYLADLIGCLLHDEATGTDIGKVVDIESNPAHEILLVDSDGYEVQVPYVPQIILEADLETKRIVASLPEGLVEVYKESGRSGK